MKHRTPEISSTEQSLDVLTAFAPVNRQGGTEHHVGKLPTCPAKVDFILRLFTLKGMLLQSEQPSKFSFGPSRFHLERTLSSSIKGNLPNMSMPPQAGLEEFDRLDGEAVTDFHKMMLDAGLKDLIRGITPK